VKRFVRASVPGIGAALLISIAALTQPPPGTFAQAGPSPSPSPVAPAAAPAASPVAAPAASPAATTPAPRAGGFPMELAWPLLAGGAAAVGAGAVLLRRGRR
jgi:DNA polymerase-3 subunit gamma/tau